MLINSLISDLYGMQPPDELMTVIFLPAMRHLVAERLRSKGLSQARIASLLGVTQASVSLYRSANRAKAYDMLAKLSVSKGQADEYSDLLADDLARGAVHGVRTLARLWTNLLGSGLVCAAHREIYPLLSECDYCIREYQGRQGSVAEVISEVAGAARLIEGSSEFIAVMPEVSVNIACAVAGASTPEDVVAIPGRIVRAKGRARAMLPPEPGASTHMAKVLLVAMSRQPQLRACINLRFDRRMNAVVRKSGLRTVTIGGYLAAEGEDPTTDAMERKLATHHGAFDAIIDKGGAGIEPDLYLFAKSAHAAADVALRLARAYSAG